MKIKHNSPEILFAEDTPWMLGGLLLIFTLIFVGVGFFVVSGGQWLGLMFVFFGGGMGLGAMAFLVERLQVVLDAQTNTATIRSRTMVRYRKTELPLDTISHAIVEMGPRSRGGRKKPTTRPAFAMHDKIAHPITEIYSGGNYAKTLVDDINGWLNRHRK